MLYWQTFVQIRHQLLGTLLSVFFCATLKTHAEQSRWAREGKLRWRNRRNELRAGGCWQVVKRTIGGGSFYEHLRKRVCLSPPPPPPPTHTHSLEASPLPQSLRGFDSPISSTTRWRTTPIFAQADRFALGPASNIPWLLLPWPRFTQSSGQMNTWNRQVSLSGAADGLPSRRGHAQDSPARLRRERRSGASLWLSRIC